MELPARVGAVGVVNVEVPGRVNPMLVLIKKVVEIALLLFHWELQMKKFRIVQVPRETDIDRNKSRRLRQVQEQMIR